MEKNFLRGVLALLIIMQAPLIYSYDCSAISLENHNLCIEISKMNLTEYEKDQIISNLDYKSKFFPDHSYIYSKNVNLVIKEAPNNVNSQNGSFVRNVWTSIFAVMPSVFYKGNLFTLNQTKVLTGFNYRIEEPVNYNSPGYPSTKNGDCKTNYFLVENKSENKIFVNGVYKGSGKLVDLDIKSNSYIESFFNVDVSYSIDHYRWRRYCCKREDGVCVRYCRSCDFSWNELKKDGISVQDSLYVKHYNNSLFAELKPVSEYLNTSKFNLSFSNSANLSFKNSNYNFNEFLYNVNYSKAPYYVLTLTAQDYKQESFKNLYKQQEFILVKDKSNCSIKYFDFFSSLTKSCNVETKSFDFKIETDKLSYLANETINVSIFPSNITVNLSYGNFTKIVSGNTVLIAELLQNKIFAVNGSFKTEKIVSVQSEERFWVIWWLVVFLVLNYLIYVLLKKYWGKILWQMTADS